MSKFSMFMKANKAVRENVKFAATKSLCDDPLEVGFEGRQQQAFPEASGAAQENEFPLACQRLDIAGLIYISITLLDQFGECCHPYWVFQFIHDSQFFRKYSEKTGVMQIPPTVLSFRISFRRN